MTEQPKPSVSPGRLPVVEPGSVPSSQDQNDPGWKVTVFNNETNTFEEVMTILMIATGCDDEEAYIETWEVDYYGKCVVHRDDEPSCQLVADIISKIGIHVEAEPDLGL